MVIKFVRTSTLENQLNLVSQKTDTLASYLELEKHLKTKLKSLSKNQNWQFSEKSENHPTTLV
jgi:hypothetical protein